MIESDIQRLIQADATTQGNRLFRNNTASGWVGVFVRRTPDGTVVLRDARPIDAGLCVGSSDLIGWSRLTIRPEHVGLAFAVFTAVEVKTPIGRPTPEQIRFIETTRAAGGIAGIARSINDYRGLLP